MTVEKAIAPEILAEPKDRTAAVGKTVKFGTVADGEELNYQWQYTLDGIVWYNADMPGSDTIILSVVATEDLNGAGFRCVVTGKYGLQTVTQTAFLTIN